MERREERAEIRAARRKAVLSRTVLRSRSVYDVPAVSVIRCACGVVLQPVKGKVISSQQIPDETFASGLLGVCVGVVPEDEVVRAPFDGTVLAIADTRHAVILASGGMEVLIHIGIDTACMKGDGFLLLVREGSQVRAGQPLIRFDLAKIRAAGYPDMVIVSLTNSDELEDVEAGPQEVAVPPDEGGM